MALVAGIQDGQIVESASQSSLRNTGASGNGMDKDAFLQLLVAQMKYQDPLEPTSNTEYISQYAQFSEVEQVQNMAKTMDLQRASSLVGQEVYMKTTSSSGETNYIQGKVDYVVYENGKAFLSINEQLYSIDDLDTVADSEYLSAYSKATDFVEMLRKLPNVNSISLTDREAIEKITGIYEEMSDYEKSFIANDIVKEMEKYVEKLSELEKKAEGDKETSTEEAGETTNQEESIDSTEES